MSVAITRAQFARQLAYLAKEVATWTGDTLGPIERFDEPMDLTAVARFTDSIRERLALLDEDIERAEASGWRITPAGRRVLEKGETDAP